MSSGSHSTKSSFCGAVLVNTPAPQAVFKSLPALQQGHAHFIEHETADILSGGVTLSSGGVFSQGWRFLWR